MHALKHYDQLERFELIDCSIVGFHDEALQQAGIEVKDLMTLIHARDANGQWLKGIAVFETAYAAAGIESMARMWANPVLRPFWNWLYPHIANNRMFLSKLGINRIFGWVVARAAKKAVLKSQACVNDSCDL